MKRFGNVGMQECKYAIHFLCKNAIICKKQKRCQITKAAIILNYDLVPYKRQCRRMVNYLRLTQLAG